jgi:hypothetical protein
MNTVTRVFIVLIFLIIVPAGCNTSVKPEIIAGENLETAPTNGSGKVRLIFYNMYLPTEVSRIFERVGANYNPDILNPSDNFTRYDGDAKIALNIGVYGVDMSYCRIFGQSAPTAKYFSTIQLLYERLGISSAYYEDLLRRLEKYYDDKDSLAKFAGEVYERADRYLRENKRDSNAAMIIAGGWCEGLYIACRISEKNPDNVEITERIAAQKYSLTSLISLLGNYQEDIVTAQFLLMLKNLKRSFDKIDIYYNQANFQLDTVNKLITATDYEIRLSPEVLAEINKQISEIRSEIIN